jgi:hypothetical protein
MRRWTNPDVRLGRGRLAWAVWSMLAVALTVSAVAEVATTPSRPLRPQPWPDAMEYADAARQLASGNGYVTYIHKGDPHPPRYPPGFSIALAPFVGLGGPHPAGVQIGSKFYAALYVVAAVGTAWLIGGPLAAALTAGFVGASPFAARLGSLILSDAFAAVLAILSLALVHRVSTLRASAAGLLAGALVVARLSALVGVAALVLALPSVHRRRALLWAAPPILALGLFHWLTFGSPLRTGYDYWLPEVQNFSWEYAVTKTSPRDGHGVVEDVLQGRLMEWVCPCPARGPQSAMVNVLFYPAILLGLFWIYAPPLATVPGLVYLWRHQREPAASLAGWRIVLCLVFFGVYYYQATRFMAAPATALAIFSSVQIAEWIEHALARTRKSAWAPRPESRVAIRNTGST